MKKNEIKVGGLYTARISGKFVTVRVEAIREQNGWQRDITVYDVTNLTTGRKTTFRSAAKFRAEVKDAPKLAQLKMKERRQLTREEIGLPMPSASKVGYHGEETGPMRPSIEDDAKAEFDETVQEAIESSEPVKEEASEEADPTSSPSAQTAVPPGATGTTEGEQSADPTAPASGVVAADGSRAGIQATQPLAAPGAAVQGGTGTSARFAAKIAAQAAPRTTGLTLTAEQVDALAAAKEVEADRNNGQRVLVLKAGAGSGKTFELQQMETVLMGIIQYTAYNKSLVVDSGTKFKRANCSTTHKLAFQAVGRLYQHRLNGQRMRSYEIAARLGIHDYSVELPESVQPPEVMPDGSKKPVMRCLKARWLAGQVMTAVQRFCQSADPAITERHFAAISGLDEKGGCANADKVKKYLLTFAQKMWADIVDPNGTLPFSHDCYVKIWELGEGTNRPVIAADCIMLDEYQDTAPVMVSILKKQTHAMLVLVGDDNQRIYEWRGAINAGDEFPGAPQRLLSKSFRFGQTVADVANAILGTLEEPTTLKMQGFERIPSRICTVAEPRCYLFRTNAGAIGKLMRAADEGKRGHLIGGTKEVVAFCKAALDLQAGRSTDHPELGCFSKWSEVQDYSKEDEGADLRLMVKLIDEFGADRIVAALENMPPEERADLILTTAHRSKGREWPSVKLGQDFRTANKLDDSERRLIYVAATRAQEELDISECPTFCGGWDKKGGGEDGSGIGAEWIPGIEIEYTAPMPTVEALAAYRVAKSAPKPPVAGNAAATCQATANTPIPAPAIVSAPANMGGNGNGAGGEFSWANMDGGWCIRGPKERKPGERVTVTRKNGTKSEVTLGAVTRKIGDLWFYAVR